MKGNHSEDEIRGMELLVEESIKGYYNVMGYKNAEKKAAHTLGIYRKQIEQILNKPLGGTFAPEEIAEIIIFQDINENGKPEESATVLKYA